MSSESVLDEDKNTDQNLAYLSFKGGRGKNNVRD